MFSDMFSTSIVYTMKLIITTLLFGLSGLGLIANSDGHISVILYVFEGSDWCTNCARLEKKILNDSAFQQQINLLDIKLERIDFPQRKKLPSDVKEHNDRIAEKFEFDGVFPTLIIARQDTTQYRRIYYQNENVEEMLSMIKDNLQKLYE